MEIIESLNNPSLAKERFSVIREYEQIELYNIIRIYDKRYAAVPK